VPYTTYMRQYREFTAAVFVCQTEIYNKGTLHCNEVLHEDTVMLSCERVPTFTTWMHSQKCKMRQLIKKNTE